jgi:secernin
MGCDMVVALGRATVDGRTLFGHNSDRPRGLGDLGASTPVVRRTLGRPFTPGEVVRTQCLEIPQVRQTYTVLGVQPAGAWGYDHGLSGQQVAMGRAALRTRLRCDKPTLLGTDLVRLVLERARSARHGVDVLLDLMDRHGQGSFAGGPAEEEDNTFLIADPAEAFAVEASGKYAVCQEVQQVRAASNVGVIRQDWDRISHGLAGYAIARGWWPADGSKLDFAGTVCDSPIGQASGLRRWGRATLLLEQQNGHVDVPFVRRVLGDHYEGMRDERDPFDGSHGPTPLCQHGTAPGETVTMSSLVAELSAGPRAVPLAWCAFGPPCVGVYFPLFLDGELPPAFGDERAGPWAKMQALGERLRQDRDGWGLVRETFGRLQACFDQEAEEFAAEAGGLKERGEQAELQRLAGVFVQHCLEQFDKAVAGLLRAARETADPLVKP